MTWQVILIFISAIVSLISSIIGGLVMYTFKSVINRLDKQDAKLERIEDKYDQIAKNQAACKIDCTREFVSAEAFVRSSAYDRQKIEDISTTLNRMAGNMTVVEKLPQISGEIAAAVTKQIMDQMTRTSRNG